MTTDSLASSSSSLGPCSEVIKILIADDSNTDRLLLKTFLKNLHYEVLIACDGQEAVEVFTEQRPAVVLLDVLMPTMDGFEAAEQIKQLAGGEFVPIIFLTSLQHADSLAQCLDAGGDDFLVKPYNHVILQAKLNAFLRMREMHLTVQRQRDEIAGHNNRLIREQEVAKQVFDKVAHVGCLDAGNIQYSLSPIAIFNGDVALAGVSPSGNLLVLLGDFTGHGLNAAIGAMPVAQTFYTMLGKGFSQRDILCEINRILYNILPIDVFCCALLAEIDFKTGALKVWNGGMPDCLIYRPAQRVTTPLRSRHLALGIKSDKHFNAEVETYEFEPGDRLYIWSDGIFEAENEQGEMFGEQRLLDVFEHNLSPDNLFQNINIAVHNFLAEDAPGDDISIIEVKLVAMADFNAARPDIAGGQQLGPANWALNYVLRPETIKAFDPLPLMLQVLMEIPFLRQFGGQIYCILTELYANAVDHGVLKLNSVLKQSPEGFSEYYRQRQQQLAQLQSGQITIGLDYQGDASGGQLTVEVTDSGAGFDYQHRLAEVVGSEHYFGRGINLLKSLCDVVEYQGCGNRVRAVFLWGDKADTMD